LLGRKLKTLQCKLLTFMCMLTDSIESELKEAELESVDWSFVARDRDQLSAFMNVKIILLVA